MNSETLARVLKDCSNVAFVYDLQRSGFKYVDAGLTKRYPWLTTDITLTELSAHLHADDLNTLKKAYGQITAGSYTGSEQVRLMSGETTNWLQVTPLLLKTNDTAIIAGLVEDVTAESENVHTLRKYANKKNSILTLLGHDLRGPLGIAGSLAQEIKHKISDAPLAQMSETLQKIIAQSIELITDLTTREFFETVDTVLVKSNVDVVSKSREYIEEYQRSATFSDRKFNFKCNKEEIYLHIDESKFMQVYNNLMSNAMKFTRPGGEITVSLIDHEDSVDFVFSDNGIGIPESFHPVLFDKYTPAARPGLNGEPTLGLGLSIVRTIVKWHNGDISFTSKENEGTTFLISIPKDQFNISHQPAG